MGLPTLYKKTKTGATQQCIITYKHDVFTVQFGQVDGAQQYKSTTCYGTNIGKSNERTPTEQAEFEAKAKWASKVKSGYTEDESGEITVNLPMKVKVYQDQLKNIKFPCQSTGKLNGVNGTYKRTDGVLKLTSRGGDEYPAIPHLEPIINTIMDFLNEDELNGELYIENTHLQDITSVVKKPKLLSKQLEFGIFDLPANPSDYKTRLALMVNAAEQDQFTDKQVFFLTGIECASTKDIEHHYNKCMDIGLEGTVIKNLDGLYQHNVRSSAQFKYKKTLDGEYEVIGYEIDKNSCPVWVLQTPEGLPFKAKPKGERSALQSIALKAGEYVGKWYKIEYEMLSKDKKPLKPVGVMFRECDLLGSPVE